MGRYGAVDETRKRNKKRSWNAFGRLTATSWSSFLRWTDLFWWEKFVSCRSNLNDAWCWWWNISNYQENIEGGKRREAVYQWGKVQKLKKKCFKKECRKKERKKKGSKKPIEEIRRSIEGVDSGYAEGLMSLRSWRFDSRSQSFTESRVNRWRKWRIKSTKYKECRNQKD